MNSSLAFFALESRHLKINLEKVLVNMSVFVCKPYYFSSSTCLELGSLLEVHTSGRICEATFTLTSRVRIKICTVDGGLTMMALSVAKDLPSWRSPEWAQGWAPGHRADSAQAAAGRKLQGWTGSYHFYRQHQKEGGERQRETEKEWKRERWSEPANLTS